MKLSIATAVLMLASWALILWLTGYVLNMPPAQTQVGSATKFTLCIVGVVACWVWFLGVIGQCLYVAKLFTKENKDAQKSTERTYRVDC